MYRLIVDLKNSSIEELEDILNLTDVDFSWDEGGRLVVDHLTKVLQVLKNFAVSVIA